MKIAIVGSRSLNLDSVEKYLFSILDRSKEKITEIISGGAAGPDTFAYNYVMARGGKFTLYRPDWKKDGKSAGFKRNILIVNDAEIVLGFWDGSSKGAKHSIDYAVKHNKKTVIYTFDPSTGKHKNTQKFNF